LEVYFQITNTDPSLYFSSPYQIATIYGFQRFTLNINMYRA
jgi:hypothetical protein